MSERVRVSPGQINYDQLSPNERASLKIVETYLGMVGCDGCKVVSRSNESITDLRAARTLQHMVIEVSELKRDVQKNGGRQLSAGANLAVSQDGVELWALASATRFPDLSVVLEQIDEVWECVNCPAVMTYEVSTTVEYQPDET